MAEERRKRFSKRHEYAIQPRGITIREDVPDNLRQFVPKRAELSVLAPMPCANMLVRCSA